MAGGSPHDLGGDEMYHVMVYSDEPGDHYAHPYAVHLFRPEKPTYEEAFSEAERLLAELEGLVERLREALKKKSKETHRLRLRLGELAEEAGEVASLLGEETAEDLRERLEAVKGLLVEAHP
jgi:hypothetical protein